jgi:guanine nucleotide-binding protein G(i) subunit alpha
VFLFLFSGAGDSGKTTIFKQMKILHQNGYTETERKGFMSIIHTNCQQNMKDLLKAMERLGVQLPEYLSVRESHT